MSNLTAGAHSTAIATRAVLYYALKHPDVLKKMEDKVLATPEVSGDSPVAFQTARVLTYLDATINEALRMHPAISMTMERYVPPEGLHLPDGSFVPAGTIVGINPFIVNRNKAVFGQDADTFRPERWLRGETEAMTDYQARLTLMHNTDLTFGAGSRICIGKHIAIMQVFKVVATLVRRYHMELVEPEKEWHVVNSWFVRQTGLKVRLSRRDAEDK
jgi:cytochrome P450